MWLPVVASVRNMSRSCAVRLIASAIAAKTVLVGASQAAQVFRKGGVRVDVANQHEDDFTNNRITVLAEERLLLAVYRPAAFVKVTLL